MCGTGHYSMKGLVIVETQEEYDTWLAGKATVCDIAGTTKNCTCTCRSGYNSQTDSTVS